MGFLSKVRGLYTFFLRFFIGDMIGEKLLIQDFSLNDNEAEEVTPFTTPHP